MPPEGYTDEDITQQGRSRSAGTSDVDLRNPFQHDVDRILYASEFRALAGKTQVIASDQLGDYHNRLTHSLKVAQLGKRMACLLSHRAELDGAGGVGPHPDLVEAAGLLHDIGHPPFGHVGEVTLKRTMDELEPPQHPDGFQANAQNLRIATYLSVRLPREERGLNLTRAALDSSVKYPWHRAVSEESYARKHWGCYRSENDALRWVLQEDIPESPQSKSHAPDRPVEEQIMDWADEVTYACHDLEDFYRSGMVPLDQILDGVPRADARKGEPTTIGYETQRFLEYLAGKDGDSFALDRTIGILQRIVNTVGTVFPFEATQDGRGRATRTTSALLKYFMGPRQFGYADETDGSHRVRLVPKNDGGLLTRYHANLHVDEELKEAARILSNMIWCYVIDRPGLASQQHGQKRILGDLLAWYANDPKRLLPAGRREEYLDHGDACRAAADTVCSLTETEAVKIHRRMSGIDYGQVTDLS